MLTDNDVHALVGLTPRMYKASVLLISFALVSLIASTLHNVYLAFHYAELFGLDFSATLSFWNENSDLHRSFSGYEHNSLQRLNNSIYGFGLCVGVAVILFMTINLRKRNARILSALIESGVLSREQIDA
jgi:hypothetical protein